MVRSAHEDAWRQWRRLCETWQCAFLQRGGLAPWTLANSAEVRIGIHYSEKQLTPTDEGLRSHSDVNYASRIMGLADGGQILLSERARDAAEHKTLPLHPWPGRRIKSWHETSQTVYELLWFDGQTPREPGARFLPDW